MSHILYRFKGYLGRDIVVRVDESTGDSWILTRDGDDLVWEPVVTND